MREFFKKEYQTLKREKSFEMEYLREKASSAEEAQRVLQKQVHLLKLVHFVPKIHYYIQYYHTLIHTHVHTHVSKEPGAVLHFQAALISNCPIKKNSNVVLMHSLARL